MTYDSNRDDPLMTQMFPPCEIGLVCHGEQPEQSELLHCARAVG